MAIDYSKVREIEISGGYTGITSLNEYVRNANKKIKNDTNIRGGIYDIFERLCNIFGYSEADRTYLNNLTAQIKRNVEADKRLSRDTRPKLLEDHLDEIQPELRFSLMEKIN
jgi:hypothetical protein